jgi:hypothetical protein
MQSEGSTNSSDSTLRPRQLTWVALLARWVDFAKSALALPNDTVGTALRDSVPDIIMLQAVTSALVELQDLPADERALGCDRAEVLIDRHADSLGRRWGGESQSLPAQLQELIDEARSALGRICANPNPPAPAPRD